jgi:methylmalonyl-CoA mutase N-terminal domain/subunit
MRFHAQTSGAALTAQQPENNVIRVTLQALAAVLGGCQSLHTNAKDEALALPSADAALQALRTQQIIADESGITDTVDPFGGSYYLEYLTNEIEKQVYTYFDRINDLGGVIPALKSGFFQREIADSAFTYQQEEDSKDRITVGVNQYQSSDHVDIPILRIDSAGEARQIANLNHIREIRNNRLVHEKLINLKIAATGHDNLMPPIMEAVKVYATLGEMMGILREVFGEYQPTWNF